MTETEDNEGFPVFINDWALDDRLHADVIKYRSAALVAYGALMSVNQDGRADEVLKMLKKTLFPDEGTRA